MAEENNTEKELGWSRLVAVYLHNKLLQFVKFNQGEFEILSCQEIRSTGGSTHRKVPEHRMY